LTFQRGAETHAVEILGQGQQFISHGMHPSGVSYEWTRGDLCELGFAGLMLVTKEQIDAFLTEVTQIMLTAGYTIEKSGDGAASADAVEQIPIPGTWTEADQAAVARYLGTVEPAIEGKGGDNHTVAVGRRAKDLGCPDAATLLPLMIEHFNPRCSPPWELDQLAAKCKSAYHNAENRPGSASPRAEFAGTGTTDNPTQGEKRNEQMVDPAPAWIAALNKHHATVNEFGKPVVYIFRPIAGDRHHKIERVTYDDFAKLGEHDKLTIEWNDGGKVKSKTMPRNLAWRHHSKHVTMAKSSLSPARRCPPAH
jgi:hypothetical protein